MNTFIKK